MARVRRDDVGRDELGVRVEGAVLRGEKSVTQALAEEEARVVVRRMERVMRGWGFAVLRRIPLHSPKLSC